MRKDYGKIEELSNYNRKKSIRNYQGEKGGAGAPSGALSNHTNLEKGEPNES